MLLHKLAIALALLGVWASAAAVAARAASPAPDFDIRNGHFFTQTAPSAFGAGAGYSVTDDEGIPFWSVYQEEGGLLQMGFPLSRRFVRDGHVTQVMQKAVFQWNAAKGRVEFINILDELNLQGKDAWLEDRLVPPHLMLDDGSKSWPEKVQGRLALFAGAERLRAKFDAARDPVRLYGLPTSGVVDYGPMQTIRLQRSALQYWKVKTNFAEAGQVVVANGGELAMQAGLFPAPVLEPEPGPGGAGARVAKTGDPVIDRINEWRAFSGLPAIAASAELMRATRNHVQYYLANAGHESMGRIGVHAEQPGLPGYTGASIYDRAKTAGYAGDWVDEDINFSADVVENVDLFVATVFHRFALLHPSAVVVGYGSGAAGGRAITVINIGLDPGHRPPVELPSVYPGPGQEGVPHLWYAYESPDPVPGLPRPVGSPLTVSFLLGQNVKWGPVALTSAAGQAVEVVVVESGWRKSIGITPARPLAKGTRYKATVKGTVNGAAFVREWEFTTAA